MSNNNIVKAIKAIQFQKPNERNEKVKKKHFLMLHLEYLLL